MAKPKTPSASAPESSYAVSPYGSVWMTDDTAWISAARAVAVDAMRALGLDDTDWRTRDKIIVAIADRINGMLDYARHNVPVSEPGAQPASKGKLDE